MEMCAKCILHLILTCSQKYTELRYHFLLYFVLYLSNNENFSENLRILDVYVHVRVYVQLYRRCASLSMPI